MRVGEEFSSDGISKYAHHRHGHDRLVQFEQAVSLSNWRRGSVKGRSGGSFYQQEGPVRKRHGVSEAKMSWVEF